METTARPLRLCDVCGKLDDHPRHVRSVRDGGVPSKEFIASLADGLPASAIAQLMDPTTVVRHMDCCAAQGCEICVKTEAATGGARGLDLLAVIQGGALADVEV